MTDRVDQFLKRPRVNGIPVDYLPVVPNNAADNCGDSQGLYVQNAGNITCTLVGSNADRVIPVAAGAFLPGMFVRVKATGTTATGIFALQL